MDRTFMIIDDFYLAPTNRARLVKECMDSKNDLRTDSTHHESIASKKLCEELKSRFCLIPGQTASTKSQLNTELFFTSVYARILPEESVFTGPADYVGIVWLSETQAEAGLELSLTRSNPEGACADAEHDSSNITMPVIFNRLVIYNPDFFKPTLEDLASNPATNEGLMEYFKIRTVR